MYCSKCGSKNAEGSKYCSECGNILNSLSTTPLPHTSSSFEQRILYAQHRKRVWVAIILNVLWAGAGCFYAKAPRAGLIVGLTFVGWLLTLAVPGFGVIVFGLFLWASVLSARHIEIHNAQLLQQLNQG